MIQIFGTAKCKTTRAAQRFFADRGIKVQFIELREKGLSKGELGLAEDPLLLRTPIVRDGTRAAVGAAEAVWKTFADAAKGKA